MDDSVASLDVCRDDIRIVEGDRFIADGPIGRGAVPGQDATGLQVVPAQARRVHQRIERDVPQGLGVGQQGIQDSIGQCFTGRVVRGEHREGAVARQEVDQAGVLNGGDEGREAGVGRGDVDDIRKVFGRLGEGYCRDEDCDNEQREAEENRFFPYRRWM
jgi:hypothetical protein